VRVAQALRAALRPRLGKMAVYDLGSPVAFAEPIMRRERIGAEAALRVLVGAAVEESEREGVPFRVLPEFADEPGVHRRIAVFLVAMCLGMTTGVFYQLCIWLANHALGAHYAMSWTRLSDRLALDWAGGCIAGLLLGDVASLLVGRSSRGFAADLARTGIERPDARL
jgi:hypothetical protein